MRAHMSEVREQAWISVAQARTAMSANGPMTGIVLLPTSVLLLTSVLKSVRLLTSALLIKSVMLTATGKIVAIRTQKAPAGKSG